jgi:cerevisin
VKKQLDATWGMARMSKGRNWLGLANKDPGSRDFTYEFDESAGRGTHVYILDTGCKLTHQEFSGRIECLHDVSGKDCKDNIGREYLGPRTNV